MTELERYLIEIKFEIDMYQAGAYLAEDTMDGIARIVNKYKEEIDE